MSVKLTVVVVALSPHHRLGRLLSALAAQSLSPRRFEVLVIADPDSQQLQLLTQAATAMPLRLVQAPGLTRAQAHTLALWAARGEFQVRIDPDDSISADFLELALSQARPDRVVLAAVAQAEEAQVAEQSPEISFASDLTQQVLSHTGTECSFLELPLAACAGVGAVVPTSIARTGSFHGEDFDVASLLYWAELFLTNPIRPYVPAVDALGVYRKTLTDIAANSVEASLAVLRQLIELRDRLPCGHEALTRLRREVIAHLGATVQGQPQPWRDLTVRLEEIGLDQADRVAFNHQAADKLVVSYAYPPTLDTSGLVVAKRMLLADEPYDVVVKSGTGFRDSDARALALIQRQLGERHVIEQRYIDVKMPVIESFINRGLAALEPRHTSRGSYPELYSRAMWPPAHIFAAAYKVSHPETHWVAEFSDPLLIGIDGERKFRPLELTPWAEKISAAAGAAGFDVPTANYWEWVESITYALADEVVFTNALQRDLQRGCVAGAALGARLDQISRVEHHPTLPRAYYSLAESSYRLDPGRIHLGYFGIFYASRGAGDVFQALRQVSAHVRSTVMLHIFTNRPEETSQIVAEAGVGDCVRVNPYVPYFEFLNLATRLDWLLVTDAKANHLFGFNPYRPSKYADYRGSGSKIWAVVEPGSLLSQAEVAASTELGDVRAAAEFLTRIAG